MSARPASLLDRLLTLGRDDSGGGRLAALDRSQAVAEFDLDGNVLDANENFLALFGCRIDDVRGRHHRGFMHAADAADPAYEAFWQSLRRGEFVSGQFRRRTPDGREVWLQATYNPVLDAAGPVVPHLGHEIAHVRVRDTATPRPPRSRRR